MKKIAETILIMLTYAGVVAAGGWNAQEIADTERIDSSLHSETSIGIGKNGLPGISYSRFVNGGADIQIRYVCMTSTGSWADEWTGIMGSPGTLYYEGYSQTKLAFDPDSKPYVLWTYNEWDPTVSETQFSYVLISSRAPSGGWTNYAVIVDSPVVGDQQTNAENYPCDFFITSTGAIHVAGGTKLRMYAGEHSYGRIIYKSYSPASGWSYDEFLTKDGGGIPVENANISQRLSMTVSSTGVPHIVYYDISAGHGWHFSKNAGGWTKEVLGAGESDYSIFVSSAGDARISCYANGLFLYAPLRETVDSAGDVGGGSSITNGTSGEPLIVYRDKSNYSLKFASKTAGGWQFNVVDSSGEFPGIISDGRSIPHLSYIKKNKIIYARWDNSAPETITSLTALSVPSAPVNPEISLNWLAPGDDGTLYPLLNAATYYIQFSTSPGQNWNFTEAQVVISTRAAARGTRAASDFSGLPLETTYYFSIWTKDYCGNVSSYAAPAGAINYILPGTITSLASSVGVRLTTLTWTAPGDDGQQGTVTRYEIRCSTTLPLIWDASVLLTSTRAAGGPSGASEQEILNTIPYDATYYFKIKAFDEFGQSSLSNMTSFYLPKCPIYPPVPEAFDPLDITSFSITARWDSNGNPSDIEYTLQVSTSASFVNIKSSYTTYGLEYCAGGLYANAGYYFRCAAKDYRGILTGWSNLTPVSPKYTKIEPAPEALCVTPGLDWASIDLSATVFSNLSAGGSGLFFEETGAAEQWSSGWTANKIWNRAQNNPPGAPPLTPNTTYLFTLKSRNFEFLENPSAGTVTAAKIEKVASIDFSIFQTSVTLTAKSTATGSGFTNLGAGKSAVYFSICSSTENPLNWSNPAYSSETWCYTQAAYSFAELGDGTTLIPNTRYFFKSNSRNQDNIFNSTTSVISKVTLCEQPGAPQAQAETDTSIKLDGFGTGENPQETLYALAVTTSTAWQTVYYSNCNIPGLLVSSAAWRTYPQWLASGEISGLNPNTTYRLKVIAANQEGAEKHGLDSVICTFASTPSGIAISTVSTSSIHINWSGNGSFYDLQSSTNPTADTWSDLLVSSYITIYYNSGLSPCSKRYYRVRARNALAVTAPYGGWTSGDDYGFTLPEAPSGITLDLVGISSFTLRWFDNLNPQGLPAYKVEFSTNTDFSPPLNSETGFFEPLEKVFPAGTLSPDTVFRARVSARSGDADKGYNFSAFTVTGDSCTLIDDPGVITFSGIGLNDASMLAKYSAFENMASDISDNGGDGVRFREPFKQWLSQWRDAYGGTASEVFSQALLPNTSYSFSVQARNKLLNLTQWSPNYRLISRIEQPLGVTLAGSTTFSIKVNITGSFTGMGRFIESTSAVSVTFLDSGEPPEPMDFGIIGIDWKTNPASDWEFGRASPLIPGSTYFFKAWARGMIVDTGHPVETFSGWTTFYTLPELPGSPLLVNHSTFSIQFSALSPFQTGSNPQSTLYRIAVSSSDWADYYWLGPAAEESYWTGKIIVGLNPNCKYSFKVKAFGTGGYETALGPSSDAWTLIEPVTSCTYSVSSAAVNVIAGGNFNNLGAGLSRLRFNIISPLNLSIETTGNTILFSGLDENTQYMFSIESVNGAGVATDAYYPAGTATAIGRVGSIEFSTITPNSIALKPVPESYNNLDIGLSGVIVYKTAPTPAADTGWVKGPLNFNFSTLPPNTTAYFKADSRNHDGFLSGETILFSTVTLADIPAALSVTVFPYSESSGAAVCVSFNADSNPTGTLYSIKTSADSWQTARWLDRDGGFCGSPVWLSKSEWGQSVNLSMVAPNTRFSFKARAINLSAIETQDSPETWAYSAIESPTCIVSDKADIYITSLTVRAQGTLSGLDTGNSGIYFKNTFNDNISNFPNGWMSVDYWTDTGLSPNTTYSYAVKTKNASGLDNGFIPVNLTTATRIENPSGAEFSSVTAANISVMPLNCNFLSNLGAGLSGWKLLVENSADGETTESAWNNSTAFISTSGLSADTIYYFRLKTRNRFGLENAFCAPFEKSTLSGLPDAPAAPADFNGISISSCAINWLWIDNAGNETGFRVKKGPSPADILSGVLQPDTTFWVEYGLAANTSYHRFIEAYNNDGSSSSTAIFRYTLAAMPLILSLSDVSSFTVRANWTDSGNSNETLYLCEGSSAPANGPFTLNSGWTSATDKYFINLLSQTTYYFRVKARNLDNIETLFTDLVSTVTSARPPLTPAGSNGTPQTPAEFSGIALSSCAIKWTWLDNALNETGFRVKKGSSPADILSGILQPDTTFWIETGLAANTSYHRFIEAYNNDGSSSSTAVVRYTLANPPAGSYIHSVTSFSVEVRWFANNNPGFTRWGILRSTDNFVTSTTTLKTFADNYSLTSCFDINITPFQPEAGSLLAETSFWYKVCAFNEDNITTIFDLIISTFTKPAPVKQPPAKPDLQPVDPLDPAVKSSPLISAPYNNDNFLRGVQVNIEPSIGFSCAIDTSNIYGLVMLRALRDNLGNSVSEIVPGKLTYEKENNKVIFTPLVMLKKGYAYEFSIAAAGGKIPVKFETVFDHEIENIAEDGITGARVSLSANSVAKDGYVAFANTEPGVFSQGQVVKCNTVTPYDSKSGVQELNGGAKVSLYMTYRDDDSDGIVDGTEPKVQINSLAIYSLNEDTGKWERLFTEISGAQKTAAAPVTHFSRFILAGLRNTDPSKAYAYPIPFNPAKGGTMIKFGRNPDSPLPGECSIRIYSISGELVRELRETDGDGTLVWQPVTDSKGRELGMGTYIYIIDSGTAKKSGKLMVIK